MVETLWTQLKTTEFASDSSGTVVILPVGSTEQHGPHLPVDVDSRLATEIAGRTAEIVSASAPILVLPTLWVSLAEHHMNFGGTLALDFSTFRAVLGCVVSSLAKQGFSKILILNGHGGNSAALTVIVDEWSRELKVPLACVTYWDAASDAFAAILDGQTNLRHACEAETSMVLAIAPHLVDVKEAQRVQAPRDGLVPTGGVFRSRRIEEWSQSGVVGAPALATSEKGVLLLNAAAEAIAGRILDGSIWPSGRSDIARSQDSRPHDGKR
jgi:creatinine amidohydrolase